MTAVGYAGSDPTRVAKSGDTMTGPLVLSGDPTVALGAATRQYVLANAGSAGVSAFAGRTGVVTPSLGDYTAAQVTNAADKAAVSAQSFTGPVSAPDLSASGLTGATAASRYVGATASGAPTAGTFAVGDFAVDQAGKIWVCTTAGTPGTWVAAVASVAAADGTIVVAGTATAPTVRVSSIAETQVTNLVTDLAGKVPTGRNVNAGSGLIGGGALSADVSLAVAYGSSAGTAAQGNDTRITGALQSANNLTDVGSAPTSLSNLGGVPTSRTVSAGTGLTGGGDLTANRSLAVSYGTTSGTAAAGNDARITGAIQSGASAGGDLGGSLPNPTVTATHLASPLPVAQGGTGAATSSSGLAALGGQTVYAVTTTKTGAYTAAVWQVVPCDATAASFTVTLPTGAAAGQQVVVKLLLTTGTNTVTVAAGGTDVINQVGTTTATLQLAGESFELTSNGSGTWMLASGQKTLSSLDSRYARTSNNLSDLNSASSARTNLGLGTAATAAIDTTASDIAALGSQSAGATGKVADAGHIHPTTGMELTANKGMASGYAGLDSTSRVAASNSALVPQIQTLTYSATVTTDVSTGSMFRVTLTGAMTLANPTNPADGQRVLWQFVQDSTGNRLISLGSAFNQGPISVVLSTGANKVDYMLAVYRSAASKWDILAFGAGY